MQACRARWGSSARDWPEDFTYLRLEREVQRGRRKVQKWKVIAKTHFVILPKVSWGVFPQPNWTEVSHKVLLSGLSCSTISGVRCPVCVCAQSLSLVRLFWDPVDRGPPGSSVHGVAQARILVWVAISLSRGSSQLRDGTQVSCVFCIGRWTLYHGAT